MCSTDAVLSILELLSILKQQFLARTLFQDTLGNSEGGHVLRLLCHIPPGTTSLLVVCVRTWIHSLPGILGMESSSLGRNHVLGVSTLS